jgi:hypothetical protein
VAPTVREAGGGDEAQKWFRRCEVAGASDHAGAMLPPKAGLKSTAEYAARSKEGVLAALRDARAARLAIPPREAHAHRLLFGIVVPLTILRIAWSDLPTRRSMTRRLIPPLLCVALATAIGIASSVGRPEARHVATSVHKNGVTVNIPDDDDDDDDDADRVKIETPGATVVPAVAAAVATKPSPPSGGLSALRTALDIVTSRIAKILAALGILEWILVWIGREHHDVMAYEISVLTGVPGEQPAGPPQLRLDFGWLWLKGWRALRFLLFLTLVSPIAWALGLIPVVGAPLAVSIEAVWTAYWASVFAIANTFVAWEPHPWPEPPWFIRVLRPVGRIPVLGIPFRIYARILTMATRNVWPACMAFEEATWEGAGLALARVVASVPFVYLVFRPIFSPAATHALIGRGDAVSRRTSPAPSR